ncbi:MAG TPA: hypothetical protein VMY05_12410 [Acidobacteriota bacterium]|nr:hypothetical protein [Acidobacteriota bacterium]
MRSKPLATKLIGYLLIAMVVVLIGSAVSPSLVLADGTTVDPPVELDPDSIQAAAPSSADMSVLELMLLLLLTV